MEGLFLARSLAPEKEGWQRTAFSVSLLLTQANDQLLGEDQGVGPTVGEGEEPIRGSREGERVFSFL